MNLIRSPLKHEVFPGLEDARYLRLHALTSIEEGTHGVDEVVELLKLRHELRLWEQPDGAPASRYLAIL